MNYTIPKDPNIIYSYMNMMLRDRYSSLEEFCAVNDADADEIMDILKDTGYIYTPDEIKHKSICIDGDINEVLELII